MKNPAPFVAALLASGFAPHLWEENENEFTKDVNGIVRVYVNLEKGVVSATLIATGKRLLTTYFSGPDSFWMGIGDAIGFAN
jgi:hypothetical protein